MSHDLANLRTVFVSYFLSVTAKKREEWLKDKLPLVLDANEAKDPVAARAAATPGTNVRFLDCDFVPIPVDDPLKLEDQVMHWTDGEVVGAIALLYNEKVRREAKHLSAAVLDEERAALKRDRAALDAAAAAFVADKAAFARTRSTPRRSARRLRSSLVAASTPRRGRAWSSRAGSPRGPRGAASVCVCVCVSQRVDVCGHETH